MNFLDLPDFFGKPAAVVFVDLLLASDNALVIALLCAALSPRRMRTVLALGTLGAVVLRVVFTLAAAQILTIPGLKFLGGALLCLIAVNLTPPEPQAAAGTAVGWRQSVFGAAAMVAIVDALMSLDNVLALAAVAGNSAIYLTVGLVLSISILMFGSVLIGQLLRRYPGLPRLGMALLGWVAGQMVVSDALIADWVTVQAPALLLVVPALSAIYLYVFSNEGQESMAAVPVAVLPLRVETPAAMPSVALLPPEPVSQPVLEIADAPQPAPEPAPAAKGPVSEMAFALEEGARRSRMDVVLLLLMFVLAGAALAAVAYIDTAVGPTYHS